MFVPKQRAYGFLLSWSRLVHEIFFLDYWEMGFFSVSLKVLENIFYYIWKTLN